MPVQMIKHNGKMMLAKQVDGKWVPDEDNVIAYTSDGVKIIPKGDLEKDNS